MIELEQKFLLKPTFRQPAIAWTVICFLLFSGIGVYLNVAIQKFSLISTLFIALAFSSLAWFLTLKTIIITDQSFIIDWLLLPKKEVYHFNEIERVSHEILKYETEGSVNYSQYKYIIHDGKQLLIYLKSRNKIVRWTTYSFGNYEALVIALKEARKRYKTNLRQEKSGM